MLRYLILFLLIPFMGFGQVTENKIHYINSPEAVLLSDTSNTANIIHHPKIEYGVFVQSVNGRWSYIRYSDNGVQEGYISNDFLSSSQSAVRRKQLLEMVKKDNTLSLEEKNLIIQGQVEIGISKKIAKLSWGEPSDINTTINASGRKEQWVYRSNFEDTRYLYFEDGKLVSISF